MRQDKEKFKIPKSVQQVIPIQTIWKDGIFLVWSYVKKKYKLNVTNFLCSERSLTCYFYCILLDVFKILFLIFIWRQISTMDMLSLNNCESYLWLLFEMLPIRTGILCRSGRSTVFQHF